MKLGILCFHFVIEDLLIGGRFCSSAVFRLLDQVHLFFLPVEAPECEPEDETTAEGDNSNNSVVPDKERILRNGDEGLTKGCGYGAGEMVETYRGRECQYICIILEKKNNNNDIRGVEN